MEEGQKTRMSFMPCNLFIKFVVGKQYNQMNRFSRSWYYYSYANT